MKKKIPIYYKINGQLIHYTKLPKITHALQAGPFDKKMTSRIQMFVRTKMLPEDIKLSIEEDAWIYIQKEIARSRFFGANVMNKSSKFFINFESKDVAQLVTEPGTYIFERCENIARQMDKDISSTKDKQEKTRLIRFKTEIIHIKFEYDLILKLQREKEEQLKKLENDRRN